MRNFFFFNKCIEILKTVFFKNKNFKSIGYLRISLVLFIFTASAFTASAQEVIPLYPGVIPNSVISQDEENNKADAVINVSRPTLTVFLPSKQKKNRTAVIICPGGGYGSLVMDREGYTIAKLFTEMGITAFVLKYRLPCNKIMSNRSKGPLQDAQQAIKQVRLMAAEFNLDTNRIGMMGFSAGGHLVSTAGTHFNHVLIENKKGISLRPDFMILVYPVISSKDSLVHKGSMQNLLGPTPSANEIKDFSNELLVTSYTPPTFLVHAADDIQVPAANSIKFYEALRRNSVVAELHIYSKGDHGFMIYPPLEEWMGRCKNWMIENKWKAD